jgi:hypothetical protein
MPARRWIVRLAALVVAGMFALPLVAQDKPSSSSSSTKTKDKDKESSSRSSRSIEDYRNRMLQGMKDKLGFADDEWKEVEPRLRKVLTLSMGGRVSFFSSRGSTPPPPGTEEPESATRARELRDLLEQENGASPEKINTALERLRAARKKQAIELDKARKDLRELLTLRQEAMLVGMGLLE